MTERFIDKLLRDGQVLGGVTSETDAGHVEFKHIRYINGVVFSVCFLNGKVFDYHGI